MSHDQQHDGVSVDADPQSTILELGSPILRTDLIEDRPEISEAILIGDLHGCYDEMTRMLVAVGRDDLLDPTDLPPVDASRPTIIFLGDLVDRGPRPIDTLLHVQRLVESGHAHCVLGNHDRKFARWLDGEPVQVAYGLEESIDDFESRPDAEQLRGPIIDFLRSLPYAVRFDSGRAVAVHAAWRPAMKQEPEEGRIRYYAIYGPTTGKKRPGGYPDRIDWAPSYRGPEYAIFGHQIYDEPYIHEFAAGIDTGCVFGGGLTAMMWPGRGVVRVESATNEAGHSPRQSRSR